MVPLRIGSGGGLPLGVERLYLSIREKVRPPAAREDVVGGRAKGLAPRRVRAARAVGDHLVVEAHLRVRAVHRDEVFQVRVGHEEVGLGRRDARQERLEIRGVQLEALLDRDRKVPGVRLEVVVDSLRVVLAVLGVLRDERDLERLLQLPGRDEGRQEVHLGRGQEVHRREGPEHPLAAAVDAARARAPGNVGHAVALGHDALRLDEVRAVTADDDGHLLLGDELLDKLRALGGVGRVVEKRQLDLHRLAADVHASGVVDLLDGELRGLLVGASDLRLLAGDGQDGADLDRPVGGAGGARERGGGHRSGKQNPQDLRAFVPHHGFASSKGGDARSAAAK